MKKLSFLVLLCALLTKAAMAATLSGIVTNATTSLPQVGQKIYINDTTYAYVDSTLTNSSGAYSFTIPSSVSTSGSNTLFVNLTACGVSHGSAFGYKGTSITYNVSVCIPPPPVYRFEGSVWDSLGVGMSTLAKVYVIAITAINSTLGDTTIAAIDSFTTSGNGQFVKTYMSLPTAWPNSIRLKAALLPADPHYANFLPTYYADTLGFKTFRAANSYVSTLNWRNARSLTSAERNGAYIVINMIAGVNTGGPGFIGGSVLMGANKSTGVGDPLSSRLLILTRSTGAAVAYTYSDASGHFSFPGVPLGTYNIFGDALGKSNPALTITLTGAKNSISDVVFEENSKSFKGHIGSLGVGGQASFMDDISVLPNPVHDFIHVRGLSSIPGEKTIVLLDMTGAEMARQTVTKGEAPIPMAALPAGMYLLRVQTSEGIATFRIAK